MRNYLLPLALCGSLLLTLGCGGDAATTASAPPATDDTAVADAHDHPTEGPHHGTLVELGSDEYHVEVIHDATSVTAYILDHSAKKAVPIAAKEVTINLVHNGTPEQFKLIASPEATDPSGQSSRFVLADAELVEHLDDEASSPKLSVTIEGTPFTGKIELSHDHSGHAH
ncbi:hypothetical protein [Aureliella helgolandensis]|uniref:Uncharacterized protein n=1 Tax=Aureliella helgolandensis TaxID=2527968 RepID=A0A518GAJ3_9BACT|nr:hypothetical protein [Aureliella helgolandensis]QDV25612.1 hypothetical protein Q31a_39380 [Aureliella helgolandensis]